MKTLLKAVAALSLAVSAVSVANAQNYPNPNSDPSGGALIVSIWDNVANASIVYAIPNTFYQDLRDGSFTSFDGAIPQFDTIFGGSDAANIQYAVTASGAFLPGFPDDPQAALFATGPASIGEVLNTNVAGAANIVGVFYGQLRAVCDDVNPCTSTNPQDGQFGAALEDLALQLPFSAATTVGNSLNFYDLAQTGVEVFPGFPPGVNATDPASVTDTLGVWLLDGSGNLSYNVIPLPAAAWLLLSGLFGFGAIARRRQAA